MAITQDDIDALDRAIVRGTLTVEIDGARVTYQSISEMLKAKAVLQAQINRQLTDYPNQSFATFTRE
ncbi:MAG: hypothetical protein U1E43_07655 [Rhodospirillales bacterium]